MLLLRLCVECDKLIDHQDKIKTLSQTHANLQKVLAEIEDIVVLPSRADMVLVRENGPDRIYKFIPVGLMACMPCGLQELLDDPVNILPAFEALTVLEGTAENAKAAWNRCGDWDEWTVLKCASLQCP